MTLERNDVESDLGRRRDDLRVIRGDTSKRRALTSVHGAQRGTECRRVTTLHFDDDEGRPVKANRVDLAARNAHVASQHAVAARLEKPGRAILAEPALRAVT